MWRTHVTRVHVLAHVHEFVRMYARVLKQLAIHSNERVVKRIPDRHGTLVPLQGTPAPCRGTGVPCKVQVFRAKDLRFMYTVWGSFLGTPYGVPPYSVHWQHII